MENQSLTKQKSYSVLVIEDESGLCEALVKELKSAGYVTFYAKDGESGLRIAFENHPDIVLLDIVMPGMDGLTVLDNLRKDSWGKDAKVFLLTNLEADNTRLKKIMEYKPSYYLVKSDITLGQIIDKIKEVLS